MNYFSFKYFKWSVRGHKKINIINQSPISRLTCAIFWNVLFAPIWYYRKYRLDYTEIISYLKLKLGSSKKTWPIESIMS